MNDQSENIRGREIFTHNDNKIVANTEHGLSTKPSYYVILQEGNRLEELHFKQVTQLGVDLAKPIYLITTPTSLTRNV